ncbi:MAG TPA: fibronectin type III domain-containing protein [Amnibacterium sp.]|nr:fibronectin type III domain-containing protein [Amnibacterium sp.]
MSRLAWVAPACVLAAVVTGGLLGGPAAADEPTPSPSPSPTGTTQLLPVVPSPTPTPSRPSPVTRLRAAVDTTGALVVSWRAGAGDTSYTATVTAQGRARHAGATATSASFSGLPPGATVRIVVIAHGPGGDSTPVSITGAMPSVVPGVTGAAMHPVAAGMLVSWHAPTVAGVRYLAQLQGADGAVRSRLVSATSATVTGLTRGVLYTGSITVVTDTGRSAPVPVDGAVWTPPLPVAAGPVAAPPPVPSSAPSATLVPHTTTPVLADSPARSTLVSSPIAAAALAGLAVVLGGVAIGLLLRRPRARGTSPLPQSVRSPRP